MIHQAIKDIKVEDFEIADLTGEKVKDSSKKTKKRLTRKRKSTVATKDVMEPDQIKFLKLNPDYQTHIDGIDTTIIDDMFNQFEKCTGHGTNEVYGAQANDDACN
ncbi:hypothetical protein ACFX11_038281 [Malus domestica]